LHSSVPAKKKKLSILLGLYLNLLRNRDTLSRRRKLNTRTQCFRPLDLQLRNLVGLLREKPLNILSYPPSGLQQLKNHVALPKPNSKITASTPDLCVDQRELAETRHLSGF
jgi:hypothetical protein